MLRSGISSPSKTTTDKSEQWQEWAARIRAEKRRPSSSLLDDDVDFVDLEVEAFMSMGLRNIDGDEDLRSRRWTKLGRSQELSQSSTSSHSRKRKKTEESLI
jgi:hypothetical protein